MKKSTLLTVASVGAVALTSAMTFAAWDNLTATTTNTVTFDRINVTATTDAMTVSTRTADTLGTDISATSEIKVDLTSVPTDLQTDTQLSLVPTVTMNGTDVPASEYKLEIFEGNTPLTNNTDSSLVFTGTNDYTVKVTPKTNDDGTSTITNEELTVKVAATFEKAGS